MAKLAPTISPQEAAYRLIGVLKRHTQLLPGDERAISALRPRVTACPRATDVVHQGDKCDVCVFVLRGTLARYHTLTNGARQYLSLHIFGDLPDLQSLFLELMDHSLTTLDHAEIALFSHEEIERLILQAPNVGFALWRQTLIDAAILREAITNNGTRTPVERLAHLLWEQFVRARHAGLAKDGACSFPLSQLQVGQMLGLSLVSVNRAMRTLRRENCVELRSGTLKILNWRNLTRRAGFDATYLHINLQAAPIPARGRALSRPRKRTDERNPRETRDR